MFKRAKVLKHCKGFLPIWPVGFFWMACIPIITNPLVQEKHRAVCLTLLFTMIVGLPLYMIVLTKRHIPHLLANKSTRSTAVVLIVVPR